MADAAYRRNDADRCFHCKDALMDAVAPLAEAEGATVVLGVNLDDLGDHRPGQRAAAERGAVFPLVDAGFTKADVRAASRELGLRTWDKPAAACLASRVPYGTPVTLGVLGAVERPRPALRALGFAELRVRHYGDLARLEVPAGRPRPGAGAARRGGRRGAGAPATATSPSISRVSARATSTTEDRRRRPDRSGKRAPEQGSGGGPGSGLVVGDDPGPHGEADVLGPEVLDDAALGVELAEVGPGPLEAADHGDVVGHAQQQRAAGGVGVALAQQGIDLEHRPARVGLGRPASSGRRRPRRPTAPGSSPVHLATGVSPVPRCRVRP